GRDPDAVLWIDHPSVSRRHARIVIAGGKAALEDLNSKNGTLLNGRAIRRRTALEDGDEGRIGPAMFGFRKVSPGPTRSARREEAARRNCRKLPRAPPHTEHEEAALTLPSDQFEYLMGEAHATIEACRTKYDFTGGLIIENEWIVQLDGGRFVIHDRARNRN